MSISNIFWSWLGSFLGIYSISALNNYIGLNNIDVFFLIGSFGASAVLLYAAPHVDFAQPRNVIGGQVLSAIVGVTIYKYISLDYGMLSALAVSISIVVMHLTKTLHPPGGATALIAVIGSSKIHGLGYVFVLMPILSSTILMLTIALIVNKLSNNNDRKYPRGWL